MTTDAISTPQVAELIRQNQQLTAERDKLESILRSIADGLLVIDIQGRLVWANTVAAGMLNFRLEKALHKKVGTPPLDTWLWRSIQHLVHQARPEHTVLVEIPDTKPGQGPFCWEANECRDTSCPAHGRTDLHCWQIPGTPCGGGQVYGRRQWSQPVCRLYQNLPKVSVEAHASQVLDPQGQPAGTVIVMRDVTALKEAERMKTLFVSNVSHELRTPLSVIKLYVSNLLQYYDRLDESKRLELLRTIKTQADTLHSLIEDILHLSRFDTGRVPLKREWFDLAALAREMLEEQRLTAENQGLTLIGEGIDGEMLVRADREQIAQVIRNLLSNAIKFTPSGGEVRLALKAHHSDGHLELTVSDTGMGIAPEDKPRLFERFYRGRAATMGIPGTGLGLAIVKEIVREHKGEILVESEVGKGTTFTVLLPREELRKRILVVDDEEEVRRLYTRVLSEADYEVIDAANGQEALAILAEERPDLVLLDIFMPRMNGYQVLQRMRADPRTQSIPVIAMTAYSDADVDKIYELGADEFLTKPFSLTVLMDVVQRLAGTSRREE